MFKVEKQNILQNISYSPVQTKRNAGRSWIIPKIFLIFFCLVRCADFVSDFICSSLGLSFAIVSICLSSLDDFFLDLSLWWCLDSFLGLFSSPSSLMDGGVSLIEKCGLKRQSIPSDRRDVWVREWVWVRVSQRINERVNFSLTWEDTSSLGTSHNDPHFDDIDLTSPLKFDKNFLIALFFRYSEAF